MNVAASPSDDACASTSCLDALRRRLLIAVCVQYAFMAALQSGLFPAVLTTVQSYVSVNNAEMAALVSIYDFVQVAASFPFSSLSQRVGSARSIAIGAVMSLCGGFFFAMSVSYSMLVVAQVLMGCGSAAITVLCPHFMTVISRSPAEASQKLSFSYAGASGGVVIAYVAAGVVGPDNWKILFSVNALGMVPLLWILGAVSGDDETLLRRGSEATISNAAATPVETMAEDEDVVSIWARFSEHISSTQKSIAAVIFHPVIVLSILSQSCIGFGVAALIAFIPKYVATVMQQTPSTASFVVAATVPATALGVLASGYLSKRWALNGYQLNQMMLCCCAVSLPFLAMFLTPNIALFTTLLVFEMFVVFASMVPSVMLFSHIVDHHLVPFANGLSNICIRLFGSVPGPLLLGYLLDVIGVDAQREQIRHVYLGVGLMAMSFACIFAIASLVAYRRILQYT